MPLLHAPSYTPHLCRSFAGEALERERFRNHVGSSYIAGLTFGEAKSWFEATNRGAIHASLLALYAWGGWLVSEGIMPMRVLISGIGFTFSLMYATQGIVNTLSEMRRASGALLRVRWGGMAGQGREGEEGWNCASGDLVRVRAGGGRRGAMRGSERSGGRKGGTVGRGRCSG